MSEPSTPTVYEFVRAGQVVERVQPSEHAADEEATRLGVLALEAIEAAERHELPSAYWRVAGAQDPADLPHAHGEPSAEPSTQDAPEADSASSIPDSTEPVSDPDDAPARSGQNPEE